MRLISISVKGFKFADTLSREVSHFSCPKRVLTPPVHSYLCKSFHGHRHCFFLDAIFPKVLKPGSSNPKTAKEKQGKN